MRYLLNLALFLVVGSTSSTTQFSSLSSSELDDIITKLRPVLRGINLPKAVRLVFHDCVGRLSILSAWVLYSDIAGGCDGCLNTDNPDNAGLDVIVDDLEEVYTENGYEAVLSRADFWALAGIQAVDKTIELNNDNCTEVDCQVPDSGLVFQWGRVDCDTSPATDVDVELPDPKMDHANVCKPSK